MNNFKRALTLASLAFLLPAGAATPFFDPTEPVHATPVDAGDNGKIARGLLVSAGDGQWVVFDQELLRPALWLQVPRGKDPVTLSLMSQTSWDNPTRRSGVTLPKPVSEGLALTPALPGVGTTLEDITSDPRPVFGQEVERGGLEAHGRRFRGHRIAARHGVLEYENGETVIREWYDADSRSLRRHLSASPGGELVFLIAKGEFEIAAGRTARGKSLYAATNHAGLRLEAHDGNLIATLAASANERRVTIAISSGAIAAPPATPEVPAAATRRLETIDTRIQENTKSGSGWTLDRIGLPEDNPWKRRFRPADIVFLNPKKAAVVTFEGDVWEVAIQGGACRWRRIAAGLCEPLSIGAADGVIQVFGRNGLTRLHDTNGDGAVDHYENHSSLPIQPAGTRGYALDMEMDAAGKTWVSFGGIVTDHRSITSKPSSNPHAGAVLEVSADGRGLEIVADQAREPFFARDPETGRIAMSEQQGFYVPSSGIFPVYPGARYGYGHPSPENAVPPAVWIPHEEDTSSASPVWMRNTAFKAWEGALLNISYGTGKLFLVRPGDPWPAREGAVIPLGIETGMPLLHARIHPQDGSIWLTGFRIYDSRVSELEAIARLRPAKSVPAAPINARLVREGVVLEFAAALDPSTVKPDEIQVREWQYRRSNSYGSPRVKRDGKQGVEPVPSGATHLSKDRRSVFIHIPDLKPTMQLEVSHRLLPAGVKADPLPVYFTVNAPPPADWAALGFEKPDLAGSVATIHDDTSATPASIERGATLSNTYGCIACHSIDGTQEGRSGPTWKGLHGSERSFTNGTSRVADDAYLREAILEPDRTIVEGYALGMGSYAGVLKDDELESIILYIRSLK